MHPGIVFLEHILPCGNMLKCIRFKALPDIGIDMLRLVIQAAQHIPVGNLILNHKYGIR